jgi:2-oxoglutarate ferredoxin oxidoreductase subunit alpha
VSYDPANHELMVRQRAAKVAGVQPAGEAYLWTGQRSGDVLLVSWGGTYGTVKAATLELERQGVAVAQCHLRYVNPLPADLAKVFGAFKRIVVPELNLGQLRLVLKATLSVDAVGINKVRGLPLTVSEIATAVRALLAASGKSNGVHHNGAQHSAVAPGAAPVIWVRSEPNGQVSTSCEA